VPRAARAPTPRSAPTIAFDALQNATTEVNALDAGPTAAASPVVPGAVVTTSAPARRRMAAVGGAVLLVGGLFAITRLGHTPEVVTPPVVRDTMRTAPIAPTPVAKATPPAGKAAKATREPAKGDGAAKAAAATSAAAKADSTRLALAREAKRHSQDSLAKVAKAVPPSVRAGIANYVQAVESRDLGKLKVAYPMMSDAQADGWKKNFDRAQSIQASLSYGAVAMAGTDLDAPFTLQLTITPKDATQPVTHSKQRAHAIFQKAGTDWLLKEIR